MTLKFYPDGQLEMTEGIKQLVFDMEMEMNILNPNNRMTELEHHNFMVNSLLKILFIKKYREKKQLTAIIFAHTAKKKKKKTNLPKL